MNRAVTVAIIAILAGLLLSICCGSAAAQDDKKKKSLVTLDKSRLLAADVKKYDTGMQNIERINLQVVAHIKSISGKGPGPAPIPLNEMLNWRGLNYFGIQAQDTSTLSLSVYRDIEKNSFIFYYIPARYYIKWNPEDGYYLAISYGVESEESNKNVLLQTRMTPGIRNQDFALLRELIKIYLRNNGESTARIVLQPLPANYVPSFNLPAVGQEDIALTGINPDTRELGLAITTDEATKELLVDQLSNILGLSGTILLKPEKVTEEQPELSAKPVNAYMRFCDNDAYARKDWSGDLDDDYSEFVNDHPLPIRLKHLCYLYNKGNELEVRGYDLGDSRMVPGQRARIDNSILHEEINSAKTLAAWYQYSFACDDEFLDQVVRGLTGGVGMVPTQDLGITMVQAAETFDQYGLHLVVVTIRSEYFDPRGEEVITQTYELTADSSSVDCAPLYLLDEAARSGQTSLYQFKLSLVSTTGDIYQDADWRDPQGVSAAGRLYIGASLIEELLASQ